MALLRATQVGRVAFVDPGPEGGSARGAAPRVVPVSFVLDGDEPDLRVVVRTTQGSRLGERAPGTLVTFEADELRPASREGWSVLVTGRAARETDEVLTARLAGRLQAWAPGFKTLWLGSRWSRCPGDGWCPPSASCSCRRARRHAGASPTAGRPATRTSAEYATDFDGR